MITIRYEALNHKGQTVVKRINVKPNEFNTKLAELKGKGYRLVGTQMA